MTVQIKAELSSAFPDLDLELVSGMEVDGFADGKVQTKYGTFSGRAKSSIYVSDCSSGNGNRKRECDRNVDISFDGDVGPEEYIHDPDLYSL